MKASGKLVLCLLLGLLLLAPTKVLAEDDEEYEEIEDDDEDEAAGADDADVAVLTKANFDAEIDKFKFALVMFYAPWCGHCKSLKPEYAKAATLLKSSHPDVLLAKVDATEEEDLGSKYEVSGYPTLKWFVDGKLVGDYGGGRQVDTIVQWIKKKTGPPTTEVSTPAELEALKKEGKVLLLGFFDKFEGEEHKAYEAVAMAKDDASFLKTSSKEVAAALGITKAPGYAVGRNYDDFDFEAVVSEGHEAFKADEATLEEKLDAFLLAEKLPAYIEFKQSNSANIFQSGIEKQVITVAPGKLLEKGGKLEEAIIEAAKGFKGKLIFVVCKLESPEVKPITQFFGMQEAVEEPQVVGFELSAGKKYTYEGGEPSAAALRSFAAAVLDGTAKKFFKSAKEPAVPTEGGVTIIVGNTVEKMVKDPTKDVLLEVYAPWCGHCKALAPVYEKLAKRFSKIDSVVIAKMDGTENEHPDIEAQGFPTLLFFPAEEGAEAQVYQGGRTLGEMTKFIKENAKVPFELPKKKKKEGEEGHDEL